MFSLIVWMHVGTVQIMTVQLTTPVSCGPIRAAIAAQPGTDHAMCAGNPATAARYVIEGECTTLERRDTFINFVCRKPAPTWLK